MRRPIVVIFLCFSGGCLTAWYGRDQQWRELIWTLMVSGVLLMYSRSRERGSLVSVSVAIASLLCGILAMNAELSRPEPLLELAGSQGTVTGVVVREKETDYGRSLLIRPVEGDEGIGSALGRRRIWVYVTEEEAGENHQKSWNGWTIRFQGEVKEPGFPRNPGSFDQETYLRTLGVQVVLETDSKTMVVLEDSTHWSAGVRKMLERYWEPAMGERCCGGLMGLLFGASDTMEETTLEAFQKIGLGHLLAVSGLHVGLVYGAVQKLLGDRGKTASAQALCGIAVIFYAALAGFSPSASRAALMIVIHGIGRSIFRPYDMVTSASVSGMILLTRQPCQILSSGFQLSMLAAFGLACVLPRVSYSAEVWADKKRSNVLRWAADKGSPMLAIQLVMGPVCARRFQCFSLWSLVLNPICIAGAGILIPLAMGLAAVTGIMDLCGDGWFSSPIHMVFSALVWLVGHIMTGMMNLGEAVSGFPGTFTTAGLPPGLMALYYCGLFTWSSETVYLLLRKKKNHLVALWMAVMVLGCHLIPWRIGLTTTPSLLSYLDYPVVFVDVGQGDCVHLQTPGGKNILIDGGGSTWKNVGKETLLPYLLYRGVTKIDLALATHLHMDHVQGLEELAREMIVEQFGTYEANRLREEEVRGTFSTGKSQGIELVYLKEGSRIQLEPGIWIDVLAPPERSREAYEALTKDDSDENDSCLIFLIHYGKLEILVTGDMGFEGEEELLEKGVDVRADILKVGHHGSKYSTSEDFLRAVGPQVAAISVGTNYFGHPSDRVIELLEKNDIIIGRTDVNGAVILRTIGQNSAELISGNGELQWRIDLQGNR